MKTVFILEFNRGCHECSLEVVGVTATLERAIEAAILFMRYPLNWKEEPPDDKDGLCRKFWRSDGRELRIMEREVLV